MVLRPHGGTDAQLCIGTTSLNGKCSTVDAFDAPTQIIDPVPIGFVFVIIFNSYRERYVGGNTILVLKI